VGVGCIVQSYHGVGALLPVGLTLSINVASLYCRDSRDGTRGLYSSLTTPAIGRCSVVVLLVVLSTLAGSKSRPSVNFSCYLFSGCLPDGCLRCHSCCGSCFDLALLQSKLLCPLSCLLVARTSQIQFNSISRSSIVGTPTVGLVFSAFSHHSCNRSLDALGGGSSYC
jgi:hypothetical protein